MRAVDREWATGNKGRLLSQKTCVFFLVGIRLRSGLFLTDERRAGFQNRRRSSRRADRTAGQTLRCRASARRHLPGSGRGRVRRLARSIGLRQDHFAAPAGGTGNPDRGNDFHRRHLGAGGAPPSGDRRCFSAAGPGPGAHGAGQRRVDAGNLPPRRSALAAPPVAGIRTRSVHAPLPAPAFRRDAAKGQYRVRAGASSALAAVGRTLRRARRVDPRDHVRVAGRRVGQIEANGGARDP